ncbi:MAG: potassium channel family protein [Actinomycetota bacterium]|nr:potassium channel family protein [Actinomycetota bacterium]
MDVVLTLAGILLIAITLRDIFATLFHPLGRGYVERWVVGAVSRVGRRWVHVWQAASILIGPLGYILVVATWAGMLTLGWALIFLPHLPDGFLFAQGLDPAENGRFVDALYVSLVNLTSLGYGDLAPEAWVLRILGPTETLFGLGLLTASISWLIAIYGVISRRDAFAHEVQLTQAAEERLGERLVDADPELLERLVASFTQQLVTVRRDLIHFPITQHFRVEDEERALSGLIPFLRRLVEESTEPDCPHALQVRGQMLGMAIEDFADTLRVRLRMAGETTEETLEHYDAHRRSAAGSKAPRD